jgi:dolichol-phosphate mannosyltransferase
VTKLVTVIVPVLDEEQSIGVLYQRTRDVFEGEPDYDFDLLFIEDGSTDQSFARIQELAEQDARVRCLRMSRNFGSHLGATAGMFDARGDMVVIMASDLQDPPEVIPDFLRAWEGGGRIVWGVRRTRKDPLLKRLLAKAFYGLIRRIALPSYPERGTGSFCLLDRCVVDAFRQFPERNRVFFGVVLWTGYPQAHVEYDRQERHSGVSKWTFWRQVKAALDTILGFSYAPVRAISGLGVLFAALSFAYVGVILVAWWRTGIAVPGWASLMAAIMFLGGLQLLALGVLGEYLWRILDESRRRPLYVIRERLPGDEPASVGHPGGQAHDAQ